MILQNYSSIRNYIVLSLFLISSCINTTAIAQENFADKCVGNWEGMMYIYGKGQLRDSVLVQLNVQKTTVPGTWTWKTKYLSKTNPMEKDYKLVLKDAASQTYITDEGDGIALNDYCFNNKLYSVFETQEVMLTSTYELQGNQLVFEVTSGKKIEGEKEMTSYSVMNLQRVVFKKMN